MLDEQGRWKYDPKACAEIRASMDAQENPPLGISQLIEMELQSDNPNVWRIHNLRQTAQREFNMMVRSNGEICSSYPDVRQIFDAYTGLEGYEPHNAKKGLEDLFDLTWNEDGTYNIHPKGTLGHSKGHNFS